MNHIRIAITSQKYSINIDRKMLKGNYNLYLANSVLLEDWFFSKLKLIFQKLPPWPNLPVLKRHLEFYCMSFVRLCIDIPEDSLNRSRKMQHTRRFKKLYKTKPVLLRLYKCSLLLSRGLSDNRSVASSRTRSPGTSFSFFSFPEGQGISFLQ